MGKYCGEDLVVALLAWRLTLDSKPKTPLWVLGFGLRWFDEASAVKAPGKV